MVRHPGCVEDCESGDSGGFSAEDAGAERDGAPTGGGEARALGFGPAAFGSEQESGGCGGGERGGEHGEDGRGVRGFIEQETEGKLARGFVCRLRNFRQTGAAGLFAGFAGDAAPAVDALFGGAFESFFAAFGDEGADGGGAEFGGLFDDPLETVEVDEGGVEVDFGAGAGFGERFEDGERDFVFAGGFDFGQIEAMVVGEFVNLAGGDAEDAGEVVGEVAFDAGAAETDLIDEEQAARHVELYFA